MPVRKIPKNHLMVTGGYSSSKNTEIDAFESLLEKDYLLLLDFDESVRSFEVQPVHIPVWVWRMERCRRRAQALYFSQKALYL